MAGSKDLLIKTFLDGEDASLLPAIRQGWAQTWQKFYGSVVGLRFETPVNLKTAGGLAALPAHYKPVAGVRNPDLFFYESTKSIDLGGVEVTTHSPDGSNADKRYPYLWASRRAGLTALIACPYQKERATGATNRLPYRHSVRNIELLDEWTFGNGHVKHLCQIVPTTDLQLPGVQVPAGIRKEMLCASDYGRLFAHMLAAQYLTGRNRANALQQLDQLKQQLMRLATACRDNASRVEPSSLLEDGDRWIQVYNTRPDSGHWERGEGQFDSIDGRIMFTIDTISFLPPHKRPAKFELWFPQLVRNHPWVVEQQVRGFKSKRFRNLMVTLNGLCSIRFADELTPADCQLLQRHQGLTLERLDWRSGIYRIRDLIMPSDAERVARHGLKNPPAATVLNVTNILRDPQLYFSTHRLYDPNWCTDLRAALLKVPAGATVLCPRMPRAVLLSAFTKLDACLVPAEDVTKLHLLALRQLHRRR